jgi:hypothetical protein
MACGAFVTRDEDSSGSVGEVCAGGVGTGDVYAGEQPP